MKILLTILLAVCAAAAQERYVKPVDEASLDRSFAAFRAKLIAAVDRRDTAFVLSILDRRVKLSFGDDYGVAAFKRVWKPNSRNSDLWRELGRVIKSGGSFVEEGGTKTFFAPYIYTGFPDDLDSYDYNVIAGDNVNLRRDPSTRSPVVARLSYNIVRVEHETVPKSGMSEYPGWLNVRTLGGLEGYVKQEFVRSPIDYRAAFEKVRGKWVMVLFLSGD